MKAKILIVDDDRELCEEMAEVLKAEGYGVQLAFDGIEAQKHVQKSTFNIIILDYKMPGVNGIEVLKSIKARQPRAKTYLVSGRPFIEQLLADENVSSLIAGRLTKPVEPEKLLALLKTPGNGLKAS